MRVTTSGPWAATIIAALLLGIAAPARAITDRPRDNLKIPSDLEGDGRALLEKAISAYKDAWASTEKRGRKFKEAVRLLEDACEHPKAGKCAVSHFRLGAAYNQVRDLENAEKALVEATKLNEDFYQAFTLLAEVRALQGEAEESLAAYDKALGIWKGYPRALKGKVESLIRLGRLRDAGRLTDSVLGVVEDDETLEYLMMLRMQLMQEVKKKKWREEFVSETDNYRVRTNVDQAFADEIAHHAELIRRAYMVVFPDIRRPPAKYEITVHKNKNGYHEAGGPAMAAGHYSPLLRNLVLYKHPKQEDTLIVLYHEAFHQFLHEYLELAPQWFNEGLGDYFAPFEYVRAGGRELMRSRANPWRLDYIKQAIRYQMTPDPEDLMLMTREEMYGSETVGVNYAMAWSIVYFCLEGKVYQKVLVRYFTALTEGKGLDTAYSESFGKIDMKRFTDDWKTFILRAG